MIQNFSNVKQVFTNFKHDFIRLIIGLISAK